MSISNKKLTTTELVDLVTSFCEMYSNISFYPYQEQFARRIIRSVLTNDGNEISALFSRQSGKSETVSVVSGGLMIILPKLANMPMFLDDSRLSMFKDGFTIGIFAPSQRQAQTTYGKIRAKVESDQGVTILADEEFNLRFTTSNGTTVALSNGSFVTAISASDGSNIEGESFMLIICEECQDISDFKLLKSIHPMGAAYNATIVKIGTASTRKGNFYAVIQRNKKDYEDKVIRIRNHFEYDYKVVSKYNEKYRKFVEQEKRRMGEKSDEFQLSYCLTWILQRGMFIDIDEFEARNVDINYDIVPYDKTATHVVGIDVGGSSDSTVITVCEVDWTMPVVLESRIDEETGEEVTYQCFNTYVKAWCEIKDTPNYEEQYNEIMSFLGNFKIARLVIDATKESALADRINANTPYEVVSYVFSSKSKSDLYKTFEREVNSGRVNIPGGEETKKCPEYLKYLQQLQDLEKSWRGTYLVVAHPPTKDGRDDFSDSHALAVWGCMDKGEVSDIRTSNRREFFNPNAKIVKSRNQHTGRRR